jgi:xylulokinase
VVGGGAKSRIWTQLIADIANIPIITLKNEETGVLGAAILAGIGIGVYKDFEEACEKAVKISEEHSPQIKNREVYDFAFEIYKTLYSTLLKVFENRILLLKKIKN